MRYCGSCIQIPSLYGQDQVSVRMSFPLVVSQRMICIKEEKKKFVSLLFSFSVQKENKN